MYGIWVDSSVWSVGQIAEASGCLDSQGHHNRVETDVSVSGIQNQIQKLGLLSHTRSYGE